jgi:hypothetical protein
MSADKVFVSICELADSTGLPVLWLKREAESGRIPSIRVERRRFFDKAAVLKALTNKTSQGTRNEPHPS